MKIIKTTVMVAAAALLTLSSARAFTLQIDIDPSDFIVNEALNPIDNSWNIFLGAIDNAGSFDFANTSFADIGNIHWNALGTGAFNPGGDIGDGIGLDLPGASWANGSVTLDTPSSQDATWDTIFAGQDILVAVTTGDASLGDGLLDGIIGQPDWSTVSEMAIFDTGVNFADAATSGFLPTFASLEETDTVLKQSGVDGPKITPEPSTAMLILLGLGLQALRRRRA